MKALTLFSGIGGFDIALERSGVVVDGVCEKDKAAQNIMRRHFPNSKLHNDVKNIGENTHGKKTIDIICGGFPCQDLSIAGRRAGLTGERSSLWYEFARIIDELEPKLVLIENVPGLLSSNKGGDFAVIVQWLAQRGYGVAWRVLDAQFFGVAQRRRRVFIVGYLGDIGSAAKVLFESEGGTRDTPSRRKKGETSSKTSTISPREDGGEKGYSGEPSLTRMQAFGKYIDDGAASSIKSRDYKDATDLVITPIPYIAFTGRDNGRDAQENISPTIRSLSNNSGGAGITIAWEMSHSNEAFRETVGGICPTLQARMGTGGNQVPMVGVRRLTPIECERLQGFPDNHTAWGIDENGKRVEQSDTQRYKQLGNAVAVPVVEWIVKRIVKNL